MFGDRKEAPEGCREKQAQRVPQTSPRFPHSQPSPCGLWPTAAPAQGPGGRQEQTYFGFHGNCRHQEANGVSRANEAAGLKGVDLCGPARQNHQGPEAATKPAGKRRSWAFGVCRDLSSELAYIGECACVHSPMTVSHLRPHPPTRQRYVLRNAGPHCTVNTCS